MNVSIKKLKPITATRLLLTYMAVLGLAGLLNKYLPVETAKFANFMLPAQLEMVDQSFVRYRMVLFICASIALISLAPLIAYAGLRGTKVESIRRLHWIYCVLAVLMLPIGWISFPFLSLCLTCWSANDYFYFFLTMFFFMALQLVLHGIFLRLTLKGY